MQQFFFNCNECVSAGIAVFGRWTRRSQNSIDYFVIMLLFGVFYGSIVSHSMSKKTRQTK